MSKAHIPPAVGIRGHSTFNNWNEKKWTNKGTDKQYVADFFIHSTTSYLMFVTNFKILGQVVPEKSLTNISIFFTLE